MTISESHTDTEFLTALMEGNHSRCSNFVRAYLDDDPSLIGLYEQVFRKTLYAIGTLWEQNLISVATEHLSTALVESLLNELYDRTVPDTYTGRTIVTACVEQERHQVGIKMVADVFEMNGWQSHFLGADVPTAELLRYVVEKAPDLLAISLSIYFHIPQLVDMLRRIRAAFPVLPIVIGGHAFLHGGREVLEEYPGVVYLPDLSAVEQYIGTCWGK